VVRVADWDGIWMLVTLMAVAVAVTSTVAAVTFRSRAREASVRERRFARLFENSHTPMLIFDADGGIVVDANPAAVAFYGHPLDRLRGMGVAEIDTMEPRALDEHTSAQRTGAGETVRILRHRLADGEERDVQVHVGSLPESDRPLRYAIVVDVTERERARKELEARRERLETLVEQRTQELVQTQRELSSVAAVVGRTVEARDPYTAGHQRRVATLAAALAHELGVDPDLEDMVKIAAELHDIGKVSIPVEILSKPGTLTSAEFELVKEHPAAGLDILESAGLGGPVIDIVAQHHERIDGSGYPVGLVGADITLGARILMVADVVEAMSSHRPYRPARGVDAALDEIREHAGTLYDEDVVRGCVKLFSDGFAFGDTN
jgi:PAS domain S-box-containing protein/putative nucleotidyltransferase with HDIG domain